MLPGSRCFWEPVTNCDRFNSCLERRNMKSSGTGLRVQPAQLVGELRRIPQRSVRSDRRIVRMGIRRGRIPLADRHGHAGERNENDARGKRGGQCFTKHETPSLSGLLMKQKMSKSDETHKDGITSSPSWL